MSSRTYSELILLPTFKERFLHLKLEGSVGKETFGYDRYLNQILYQSPEWKSCRRDIIIRDEGRDLSCEGFEIYGLVLVHHLNPISIKDILDRNPKVFDPENLITTSFNTHQAIHYGDESRLLLPPTERQRHDTCPWRR